MIRCREYHENDYSGHREGWEYQKGISEAYRAEWDRIFGRKEHDGIVIGESSGTIGETEAGGSDKQG